MKKQIFMFFAAGFLSFAAAVSTNAQTDTQTNQSVVKPVKIKKKPKVQLVTCGQSVGLVQLRVTFDKSAKITEIELVKSSGCEGFDQNAIRAARGIRFEPAIKDGEAITVTKPVEYRFNIY